jgi:uncharacterized protein YxjI
MLKHINFCSKIGGRNMRYILKEKLFSWGNDFYIKDEFENDVFFVDGKAFTIGAKLSFQDLMGNELAFIQQKLLSWGPTYEIYRDGRLYAVVKKQLFTFFKHVFTIDVPGPDDLEAKGDFMGLEYAFSRRGQHVAQVSRKWFSLTDTHIGKCSCYRYGMPQWR